MLTKMIDGRSIELSPEEEVNVRDLWDLNTKYPEYAGHCAFDGVNPPYHDMEQCRLVHASYLKRCVALALDDVRQEIENLQETGQDFTAAYAKRKAIKQLESQDLSVHMTIGELKNSIPADLASYWNKVFT